MRKYTKRDIGNKGEQIATDYLEKNGYEIIKRNFYSRQGEIDIIAKDKKEIVFIEVKTRRNDIFGKPSEAVDYIKQKHMYNAARNYLYKIQMLDLLVRFDVIEVIITNKKYNLNHIKQIF